MEVKILKFLSLSDLERAINAMFKLGFRLHGPLVIADSGAYVQMMIKGENEL